MNMCLLCVLFNCARVFFYKWNTHIATFTSDTYCLHILDIGNTICEKALIVTRTFFKCPKSACNVWWSCLMPCVVSILCWQNRTVSYYELDSNLKQDWTRWSNATMKRLKPLTIETHVVTLTTRDSRFRYVVSVLTSTHLVSVPQFLRLFKIYGRIRNELWRKIMQLLIQRSPHEKNEMHWDICKRIMEFESRLFFFCHAKNFKQLRYFVFRIEMKRIETNFTSVMG